MERDLATETTTREAIIDSAEELWGKYGLEGVTLQRITAHAGCGNASAINYHFKNRDGLIEALYRSRVERLEKARERLLEKNGKSGSPLPLRTVIDCLFRPFADLRDRGGKRSYAAFLSRLAMAGLENLRYEFGIEAPVTDRLSQLLFEYLSFLTRENAERRISLATGLYWHGLIYDDANESPEQSDHDATVDLLALMEAVLMHGHPVA